VDEVDCLVALAAVSSGRYRDVRDRELWPMGTGWLFAADPTGRDPCLVLPCRRHIRLYDSQEQPYILMNGTIIGVSQPRGSFYFDVKSGFYHVTVYQYLNAPEEAANINLTAGEQVYLKIVSLTDCIQSGSNRRASSSEFSRPCFYVWNMPTQIAQADVARTPFYGGNH